MGLHLERTMEMEVNTGQVAGMWGMGWARGRNLSLLPLSPKTEQASIDGSITESPDCTPAQQETGPIPRKQRKRREQELPFSSGAQTCGKFPEQTTWRSGIEPGDSPAEFPVCPLHESAPPWLVACGCHFLGQRRGFRNDYGTLPESLVFIPFSVFRVSALPFPWSEVRAGIEFCDHSS